MATLRRAALMSAVQCPVVFTTNVLYPAFDVVGPSVFSRVPALMTPNHCKVLLMPSPTSHNSTIESRAKALYSRLERICDKEKSKVHLIAHSFSGVDSRAMISLFKGHELVHSLATINTPHLGLRLADILHHDPSLYMSAHYERTLAGVGMTALNLAEFCTPNIQAFNTFANDHSGVKVPSPHQPRIVHVCGQPDYVCQCV